MSDQPKTNRSLSEISHLFLTDVRERQTGGAARPRRIPPSKPTSINSHSETFSANRSATSIDLSPEEFAQVLDGGTPDVQNDLPKGGITAVLASHLTERQAESTHEYARHVAKGGGRIGLIEIDACELRITCFDASATAEDVAATEPAGASDLDPRRMAEVLEELSWDVDRWLLVTPTPRTTEARDLLRKTNQWTVLSTCDHDGVIACYRTLKGLADGAQPRLSLALLNAKDNAHAAAVHTRLAGVTRQFLDCPLAMEERVVIARGVAEHTVMHCRSTKDKAQLAAAPQWRVVANFLDSMNSSAAPAVERGAIDCTKDEQIDEPIPAPVASPVRLQTLVAIEPLPMKDSTDASASAQLTGAARSMPAEPESDSAHAKYPEIPMSIAPASKSVSQPSADDTDNGEASFHLTTEPGVSDVIDLAGGATPEAAVLSAVVGQDRQFIPCPIKPPNCEGMVLAVARDRRLTLLAVAGKGLRELRAIGNAFRWLAENRGLIAMALPQFAIDAHAMPALRLLVDHADLAADVLQPMLQSSTVTVQAYRKLRWGMKTGLLLEAA